MGLDAQEEVLQVLRSQQRELSELRQSQLELMQRLTASMDAIQSSVLAIVEQAIINQQEQSRILPERGRLLICPHVASQL